MEMKGRVACHLQREPRPLGTKPAGERIATKAGVKETGRREEWKRCAKYAIRRPRVAPLRQTMGTFSGKT